MALRRNLVCLTRMRIAPPSLANFKGFKTSQTFPAVDQEKKVSPKMGYKCPHCAFVSELKDSVKKHVVNEHKVKPFACPDCGEGFTNFRSMNKHITEEHKHLRKLQSPYEMVALEGSIVSEKVPKPSPKAFKRSKGPPEMVLVEPQVVKETFMHQRTADVLFLQQREALLSFSSNNLSVYPLKQTAIYIDVLKTFLRSSPPLRPDIYPLKSDALSNHQRGDVDVHSQASIENMNQDVVSEDVYKKAGDVASTLKQSLVSLANFVKGRLSI